MDPEPTLQPLTPTLVGPYKFNIATGTSDSRWYDLGNELVSPLNGQVPTVQISVKETKSLMANVDLLTAGKSGLAFVYDFHVVLANQGRLITAFPDAPIETITIKCGTEITRPMFPDYGEPARIVLPLYEQPLYILAANDSGIASLNDLKGRHVGTGEIDSATEQQARFVVNGLGMDWEKDIVHESFDISTAIEALTNAQIDALFWSGDVADPKITDLLSTADARFVLLPIDDTDAQKIMNAEPGIFHQVMIPSGSFVGVTNDVNTLAVTVVLATLEDFPATHVEKMLSVIFGDSPVPDILSDTLPASPAAAVEMLNEQAKTYLHLGLLSYLAE